MAYWLIGVLFGVLVQLSPWLWSTVVAGISSLDRLSEMFEAAVRRRKRGSAEAPAYISRIVAWWTGRSMAGTVMDLSGKVWRGRSARTGPRSRPGRIRYNDRILGSADAVSRSVNAILGREETSVTLRSTHARSPRFHSNNGRPVQHAQKFVQGSAEFESVNFAFAAQRAVSGGHAKCGKKLCNTHIINTIFLPIPVAIILWLLVQLVRYCTITTFLNYFG